MTPRYIIKGWEWYDAPASESLAKTVYEPEPRGPIDTGLLDPRGQKILRAEQRNPIGFVWPKEGRAK